MGTKQYLQERKRVKPNTCRHRSDKAKSQSKERKRKEKKRKRTTSTLVALRYRKTEILRREQELFVKSGGKGKLNCVGRWR